MSEKTNSQKYREYLLSIFISEEVSSVTARGIAEELARQEAEIDCLRTEAVAADIRIANDALVIAGLTAERDAAQADAKRYQWLRSRVPGGAYRIMGVIYSEGGAAVDESIDKAMGEQS